MNMQCNESVDENYRVSNVSTDATEAMHLDMDEIVVKSLHQTHCAMYECEKQMHTCLCDKIGLIAVLLIVQHIVGSITGG